MDRKSDNESGWPAALWVGVTLSIVWLVVLIVYAASSTAPTPEAEAITRWQAFWRSPPNSFGDALAGISAPLAFLWLVVATLLQSNELGLQRAELTATRQALLQQADQLRKSADQLNVQSELMSKSVVLEASAQKLGELDRRLRNLGVKLHVVRSALVVLKPVSTPLQNGTTFSSIVRRPLLGVNSAEYEKHYKDDNIDDLITVAVANLQLAASEIQSEQKSYRKDQASVELLEELLVATNGLHEFCAGEGMAAAVARIEGLNIPTLLRSLERLRSLIVALPQADANPNESLGRHS